MASLHDDGFRRDWRIMREQSRSGRQLPWYSERAPRPWLYFVAGLAVGLAIGRWLL